MPSLFHGRFNTQGYAKLGDFGFAKVVEPGTRTYTFCGTPGYVAPENVMGRGYNQSVDWWTLGVLTYVLLTARQPFTSPKAADPMEVMRRIVDDRWPIRCAPYMSVEAQDLVTKLLERKPVKRIGCFQGRAADIKKHPWFKVICPASLTMHDLHQNLIILSLYFVFLVMRHNRVSTGMPFQVAVWSLPASPRMMTVLRESKS